MGNKAKESQPQIPGTIFTLGFDCGGDKTAAVVTSISLYEYSTVFELETPVLESQIPKDNITLKRTDRGKYKIMGLKATSSH